MMEVILNFAFIIWIKINLEEANFFLMNHQVQFILLLLYWVSWSIFWPFEWFNEIDIYTGHQYHRKEATIKNKNKFNTNDIHVLGVSQVWSYSIKGLVKICKLFTYKELQCDCGKNPH
jgi:hypothetical protein